MFWKDDLARRILAKAEKKSTFDHGVTFEFLKGLQSKFPSLRVKTVDAKGMVPVIQLSAKMEWMKPEEWAHNHIATLMQRFQEEHDRLVELGRDPLGFMRETAAAARELILESGGDPDEFERLRDRARMCENNYCDAMDAAATLYRGEKLSLDVQTAVARWNNGEHKFFF